MIETEARGVNADSRAVLVDIMHGDRLSRAILISI